MPSASASISPTIATRAAAGCSASAPTGFRSPCRSGAARNRSLISSSLSRGGPSPGSKSSSRPSKPNVWRAALAELASIEALIRDCEKDWKSQLSEWWKTHDNALRMISAQPIADGEKQTRRTAYYKKLFDEQHAGLDKLLAQFEPPTADPAVPKP